MLLYNEVVVSEKLGRKIAGGCGGKMVAFLAEDVLFDKTLPPGITWIEG